MSEPRQISQALSRLLQTQADLHARARKVDEEVERASLAEASAVADFKLAHATAYLAAEGPVATKTAVADRDTIALLRALEIARALRRAAMEASSTLHHELDAYAALCHGWNRELKTELELAGPGRGR